MAEVHPLLRYLLSRAQKKANGEGTMNTMGSGVASVAQRNASGNKFMALAERQARRTAKSKGTATALANIGKGKKKKKATPPVQLPETPPEEELGIESNLGS